MGQLPGVVAIAGTSAIQARRNLLKPRTAVLALRGGQSLRECADALMGQLPGVVAIAGTSLDTSQFESGQPPSQYVLLSFARCQAIHCNATRLIEPTCSIFRTAKQVARCKPPAAAVFANALGLVHA